jgi:sulfur carrier protein ThiS adenylyltransferase
MTFAQIKEKLSGKTVGIAGCGGLGSNSAVALARVGIGKLIVADFDIIIESNLNRQYFFYDQLGLKKCIALKENISRINPSCIVLANDIELDSNNISRIFGKCDIVIEAFDRAEVKKMIIETMLVELPNIPLIVGSGLAGWGNNNDLKTNKNGNLYICGDGSLEVSEQLPPLAPRVGIVANMQANLALEILLR